MKKIKKALSLLLVLAMVMTLLPAAVFADEPDVVAESVEIAPAGDEATDVAPADSEIAGVTEEAGDITEETVPEETVEEIVEDVMETDEASNPALAAAVPQAVDMDTITKTQSVSLDTSKFYTIFHLDCGRNYFSVQQIKNIIDEMAKDGYNTLELAVGNDALRLVLDDMSVTANGKTYDGTTVANALKSGNSSYRNNGTNELTQAEMDTIISYANSKGISIIPLVNAPGHANTMLAIMKAVGISNPAYNGDSRTIDVRNAEAVNFSLALVNKYIQYFASKGCRIFNMGADEYANDTYDNDATGMGFGNLISTNEYNYYVEYVNSMAAQIQNAGMTAMAFNDGIYYGSNTSFGTFDSNIAIAYWSTGWGGYKPTSAAFLAARGHNIINTNEGWYYVVGRDTGLYSYDTAVKAAKSTPVTDIPGNNDPAASGAMVCLWYDSSATYSESKTLTLLSTLAENNPDYFTSASVEPETPVTPEPENPEPTDPEIPETPETPTEMVEKTIDLTVGETKTDVQEGSYPGSYPTADTSIATASVTTGTSAGTPGTEGKATKVTSVSNGEYILGNGSQWIVLNADGTIGSTTDAAKATKWTVTKSGSSYTFKSGSTYLGIGTTTIPGTITSAGDVKYSTVASSDKSTYASTSYYYLAEDGQYYPVYYTRTTSGGWFGIGATTTYTLYYNNGSDYIQFANGTNGNTTVPLYITSQATTQTGLTGQANSYNWSLNSNYGFYNGSNYIKYNNGWTLGSRSSSADAFTYSYTPGTDAIPGGPITTASFKGVSEGTTTVTIGNVHYTINVADKAPTGAYTNSNLILEYWITNYTVHKTTSSSSASSVAIPSSAATSNDGVAITDYAPEQAYSFFDGTKTVYYWQSMRLDANNKQTTAANDDETADGTTFTRVRYHGGAWQYMTKDGAWHYFQSTDQAVAYYMQKTDVTTEITTYMKDWGWGLGNQDSAEHVMLSVGVVYPDGTLSPSESDIYSKSSTLFNYWSGRDIGIVAPVNNSDYEISKITYTRGTRDGSTTSNKWSSTGSVTWNKTTTAAGSTWYDETIVWEESMGTTPMVNGKISNITWPSANTGVLILIYLKPIHHDSNLTVKWVDDTANVTITSQEVVVDYTGSTAPTFITDIYNNGKKGASAGTIDLKDDAYIINKAGVHQTFNKELTVMPNIPGQYTSGLYKYVSADISEDGKTLTLHYTMDASKLSNKYVVDFGLGVDVPLSDFGITNLTQISKVTTTSNATYANGILTYKPASVMKSVETVAARVEFSSGNPQTLKIGFIPATSVYYEEGYATLTGFSGGSKGTAKQAKQKAGESTDEYGYDAAYASNNGASAGSEAVSTAKGDFASVDFVGTGVDAYFNCSSTSDTVTARVIDSTGKTVKIAIVVTKAVGPYGSEVSNASYNSKILAVKGLPYGNYTLKLTAAAADVHFDGFRVYGTLADQANQAYVDDFEDNPSYLQMRNAVLTAINAATTDSASAYAQVFEKTNGEMTGAVVTDVNSDDPTTAETMLKDGPKNELYLAAGQTLTFKVTTAREVQIGLKSPNGATTCTVNGTPKNINSSVDMFYRIADKGTASGGNLYTIKNTGSKVLSVTDLKVCDAPAVLGELTESDIEAAIAATNAPVVENADATVNVKLADYTGKVLATTALTMNGVVGETATVAAADIQTAAQAVLPAGYGIAPGIADASVAFGETAEVTVTVGKVATLNITYKKGSKKVGTATLTAVQTSKSSSYTFSTSEIKAAAPAGYSAISLVGTSVKYGSSKNLNATCR